MVEAHKYADNKNENMTHKMEPPPPHWTLNEIKVGVAFSIILRGLLRKFTFSADRIVQISKLLSKLCSGFPYYKFLCWQFCGKV